MYGRSFLINECGWVIMGIEHHSCEWKTYVVAFYEHGMEICGI